MTQKQLSWPGMGLGRCYDAMGKEKEALAVYRSLMKGAKDIFMYRQDIGDWFLEHGFFPEAEEMFRIRAF